jgi:hypothetical protein
MDTLRLAPAVPASARIQAVSVLAPPVPFGHHHLHLRVRTVCRSAYAQELLPLDSELPGPFNLSSYDHDGRVQTGAVHRLSENKYKLRQAFEACGVPQDMRALMLAMAMQESTHMDVRERDASKDDHTDKAAKATIFNLSVDLIEQTGYFYGTPGRCLNPWEWHLLTTDTDDGLPTFLAVKTSVGILKRAFEQWGIENTLAFVRQGREGFDPEQTSDWREFVWGDQRKQVFDYLNCIKTYLHYIDEQPSLFWNERRPDISCEGI